jgi:hypothetical protein
MTRKEITTKIIFIKGALMALDFVAKDIEKQRYRWQVKLQSLRGRAELMINREQKEAMIDREQKEATN